MSWYNLPPEIRNKILFTLVEDKSRKLASAAAVCHGWQAVIEPHTFANIRLTPSRLTELNSMTRRSRSLVRYLWFCIELPRYQCTECDYMAHNPVFGTSDSEGKLIEEAFQSLFSALSSWEPSGDLTLDISLYSNSDNEHAFKYITFMPDAPGHGVEQMPVVENEQHDKHRWKKMWWASGPLLPPLASVDRLFGSIILNTQRIGHRAPGVPAVTRLVMRLQTHRSWSAWTVKKIVSRLPGLREFHYEPWRLWSDGLQELDDDG